MADWFSENAPKPQAGGDWFASNAPAPGFGQRLYQQTLEGPVELAKGLWNDPKGTLMKTIASMAATQIQAARNPVQVQQGLATPIIEDVRSGNWPGAAGGVTGLALDVLAPKLLSKAPGAAKVAGAGARAAAPDVASGAAKVGASYVMEHMLPGAGYLKYAVELPYAYSGAKQIGLGLRKGVAASREALKARAQAAAEALAAERAAAQPAPVPLIPEERRLNAPTPPPDTSYVRAVPAGPLPPSRQLAAPGRPAIITPAPDPLAGDTSGVRSVPAVYGTSATNEAATGMREAMDLGAGEFTPPATRTAPIAARASQIDQMARHMRQSGITAAQAALLDPPELSGLAQAAGIEGPLGKVAVAVRKRLAAMEKAEAETAKYQAAWDKLKPAEKAAVTGEAEAPAVERKPPATAEEANQALGELYGGEKPVETAAALTAPEKRINGLAAILADGPLSAEQLRGGLKSGGKIGEQQRLVLQQASEDAGFGKPTFSELDQIVDEVERLRGGRWISEEGHVKDIPDTVHAGQIQLEGHHPSPLEKAMVFDLNTGEQLEHYAGTASSADQSIYGSGKYHSDREVIQMHTHPNQSSFSDGDWKYFSQPNVREMRIIGTDRIYQLKKGKGWDSMDWKERTARKVYDRWNRILDEYAAPGEWDATTMASDVNKQMAKEFGVTFTSMPRTKPAK